MTISPWWSYDAYSDYTWADLIIENKQSKGWEVVQARDNFSDLARFWTIFKTPVTTVIFVKPDEIHQLDDGHVLAKVLDVRYDYSRTSEDEHFLLNDCKQNRFAYLDKASSSIDSENLVWSDNAKQTKMSDELVQFFCKRSAL